MALLDLQGIEAADQEVAHCGWSTGSILLCTGYSTASLLLC